MKITKQKLQKIIREELHKVMGESKAYDAGKEDALAGREKDSGMFKDEALKQYNYGFQAGMRDVDENPKEKGDETPTKGDTSGYRGG